MKNSIFLIFYLLFLTACENVNDYDDYNQRIEYFKNIQSNQFITSDTLTIITWNIQLSFGAKKDPWSNEVGGQPELLDSIANLLLKYNPDIVLLQEVPYDRENTIIKRVLDTIAVRMDYNYAFGGHGFNSNGTYPTRAQWGNAILTKFNIANIENREIFNLNNIWSRRSILRTTLEVNPNQFVDAYSLHFSTDANSEAEFLSQAYKTKDFYSETNYPKIVGGDFNYSNSINSIFDLINCSLPTEDDIDKIYISEHFQIISNYSNLIESINISDHFAGMVKVKFIP